MSMEMGETRKTKEIAGERATKFSLKTQLVSEGVSGRLLAQSDLLEMRITVYASGGENFLHAHPAEDHAFVVLEGEATFHDAEGKDTVVRKWEGILLPRGIYYNFTSTGSGPLVLLRSGAVASGTTEHRSVRAFPAGEGDARRMLHQPTGTGQADVIQEGTQFVPGKFFADPDQPD